jgi:hypothetical protein
MRGPRPLPLLCLLLLAGTALAATGIVITPAVRYEFTDCGAGGSASQTVTGGTYLLRVTDADTFLCWAATCATGGEKFPAGSMLLVSIPATQAFSCRSAGTGDVILTRGG